ncbi:MAG: ABC transporter ATP-binding protein [Planctomycetes bacterium]|nr:ABC transporter ATP-binding protein [Planctomycetota bacterium]
MSIVLAAEHVRVEYGSFVALPDFDLTLSAGNLLGLIGPNGAGKTTSLKAIAGLIPMAAGRVNVLGERVTPGNTAALSRIGFAPDTPPSYDEMTVEDFLRFIGRAYRVGREMTEERIDYWLEQLWLSDRRTSKIKALSRGMKQRLTVARTLLPDPALVLLDEPAAGLDPAGRVQFRKMLGSLRDSGKALIVSSHILADLHEYCTHIGIMEGGKMRQFGTVAQIVHSQEENRCLYDVTLARMVPEAHALLGEITGLSKLDIQGRQISFEFEHDDEAAAQLLARLLAGGLPIARFAPVDHDLEQAYLRTGIKQVD